MLPSHAAAGEESGEAGLDWVFDWVPMGRFVRNEFHRIEVTGKRMSGTVF